MHGHKSRLPAIATDAGTVYRKAVVDDHLASLWHNEAKKCDRLTKLSKVEIAQQAPLNQIISKSNEALANKVGNLMITVYNDAKRLTLSGHSWPSRVVACQKGFRFAFNETQSDITDQLDLQYVNPMCHGIFLKCITQAHSKEVLDTLMKSRALSLRLDGSVDRTQIDKIYVLAKSIDEKGESQQTFLGVAEPDQKGAVGIMNALKQALTTNFGDDGLKLLRRISSIVTDGASVNVGEKGGVWKLLETEIKLMAEAEATSNSTSSDHIMPVLPLLKVWCAVHRSQLVWHSVSATVIEVKHCFQNLISLVSYFHTSGVKTRELRELAEGKGFNLLRLPTVFDVRWTEFSFTLMNAVLTSWQALTTFLQNSKEVSARGHFNFLTSYSNLKVLAFLADLLFIFARFQKRLQRDTTTILDMQDAVTNIKSRVNELKQKPLIGGWQETLANSVIESEGILYLKDIKLSESENKRRREQHHLFVSDKRDCAAVCNEIAESLIEFLCQRFSADEAMISLLVPFVQFDEANVNLRQIHDVFGSDLDITELSCEFTELAAQKNVTSLKLPQLVKQLAANADSYPNVLCIMSRILAAKPHSADVERCISTNNLLKTSLRASLKLDTENSYLFVHHNLPPTATWDPRLAVLKWLTMTSHRDKTHKKAKYQSYFRHVFSEAHEQESVCDEPDEDLDQKEANVDESETIRKTKGRHF
jgi:hypothetical protein